MMFLKTWQYSQEDTCVAISFFFDKERLNTGVFQ